MQSGGHIMTDTILVTASSIDTIGSKLTFGKKNKITGSKLITPCNFPKDYAEEVLR
jgi:hypothetical protein